MLAFCPKCNDVVEYVVKEEKMIKTIKGKQVKYMGKKAYCSECGSELFVSEIQDYNLKIIDKAFTGLFNYGTK